MSWRLNSCCTCSRVLVKARKLAREEAERRAREHVANRTRELAEMRARRAREQAGEGCYFLVFVALFSFSWDYSRNTGLIEKVSPCRAQGRG
eukprot:SAG31_NODE_272_length_18690_cov_14.520785_11_plen_92_part_00